LFDMPVGAIDVVIATRTSVREVQRALAPGSLQHESVLPLEVKACWIGVIPLRSVFLPPIGSMKPRFFFRSSRFYTCPW